jgi:hypothetical protein
MCTQTACTPHPLLRLLTTNMYRPSNFNTLKAISILLLVITSTPRRRLKWVPHGKRKKSLWWLKIPHHAASALWRKGVASENSTYGHQAHRRKTGRSFDKFCFFYFIFEPVTFIFNSSILLWVTNREIFSSLSAIGLSIDSCVLEPLIGTVSYWSRWTRLIPVLPYGSLFTVPLQAFPLFS